MKKVSKIIIALLFFILLSGKSYASIDEADIAKGIPGARWGDDIKKVTGYKLKPSGEPQKSHVPQFFTVLSPSDFRILGLSTKEQGAWTEPVFWFYKGNFMGIQLELLNREGVYSILKKTLGTPDKTSSNGSNFGIVWWKVGTKISVKFIDVRGWCMVRIDYLPAVKELNKVRNQKGFEDW